MTGEFFTPRLLFWTCSEQSLYQWPRNSFLVQHKQTNWTIPMAAHFKFPFPNWWSYPDTKSGCKLPSLDTESPLLTVGWSKRKHTARLPQLWLLPGTYSECTFHVAFAPVCWPEEHSVMYEYGVQNGMVMIHLCSTLWCSCFTVITEQYSETCIHSSLCIFFHPHS